MQYNPSEIEKKWQKYWEDNQTFKTNDLSSKPKYYILDMFPYPSGAGLHVGHPLGYIASDILARYRRHLGYEVLHPMGFDAFGLPAEQFALDTGNHPAIFTDQNIERYRQQLKMIGLSFDWSREVKTSDPAYYKWTQWIFLQLFDSWYNIKSDRAESIETLITHFQSFGTKDLFASQSEELSFTAQEWINFNEDQKQKILLNYRLAYLGESEVNWCPALGTVLANEEVKDGLSERGGHPVVRKSMRQWFLRITSYADRLLNDLDKKDWPEAVKEMQRHWIGKSVGAEVTFKIADTSESFSIFTTRPDTIFGATFIVLAPEHPLVDKITSALCFDNVKAYQEQASRKSDRERTSDVKTVSGCFTGAYCEHPFMENKKVPIWIADYVLADYGKGAIMAVPAHDSRDFAFAKHFGLEILEVVSGGNVPEEVFESKQGILVNSDFLNGLEVKEAIIESINKLESIGIGHKKINFRLRDANFSRQRYWGEPIPMYYKNDIPYPIPVEELPLILPDVQSYKPSTDGESPLANLTEWVNYKNIGRRETNTMPGWAGSSWYYLRYMDPNNQIEMVSKENQSYWQNVDFYLGGSEHATGHLLYARFWHRFLYDRGFISSPIGFKKLINQGMIQGRSSLIYRIKGTNTFVSKGLKKDYDTTTIRVDVNLVENDILNIEAFKLWREEYQNAEFILEDGKFICGMEVEKMSKSKYNVITPDAMIEQYGCDCFRMYEMFLGPIEQSKPWNTEGIDGVNRFIKKLWNLFYDQEGNWLPSKAELQDKQTLKILHKSIKKLRDDIDRFSLNTCISSFMILVNDLTSIKCKDEQILKSLLVLISPFAPHLSEELWSRFGNLESITTQPYPEVVGQYLIDDEINYAIQVNGKLRGQLIMPNDATKEAIEKATIQMPEVLKWLDGQEPKKIIVVPKKLVNVVI